MTLWSKIVVLRLEANHVHFHHFCHIFLDQLLGIVCISSLRLFWYYDS